MSHPLRGPLVRAMGERGFLGFYVVVSFATLGWLAYAYYVAPPAPPIWPVGDTLWAIVSAVMLIASILFVGSLVGNPAFPDPRNQTRMPGDPRGVRSEEHTSELQSLMRISYAVFCLTKKKKQ